MEEAGSDVEGTPPDLWGRSLLEPSSWLTSLSPSWLCFCFSHQSWVPEYATALCFCLLDLWVT